MRMNFPKESIKQYVKSSYIIGKSLICPKLTFF